MSGSLPLFSTKQAPLTSPTVDEVSDKIDAERDIVRGMSQFGSKIIHQAVCNFVT